MIHKFFAHMFNSIDLETPDWGMKISSMSYTLLKEIKALIDQSLSCIAICLFWIYKKNPLLFIPNGIYVYYIIMHIW